MTENNLKRTPLYAKHLELGAKMVPFGGWDMPVQYEQGILAEHAHTRTEASLFDISHMGEFRIKGAGAAAALDAVFPRMVSTMKTGACRYNFLLTDEGTVADDLIVYRIADEEFYIVVNAATREGDAARISANLPQGVAFSDESDDTVKLDLQGPKSEDVLRTMGVDVSDLRYFGFKQGEVASIPCLISRTGYTGELGYELYAAVENGSKLWDALLENETVQPAGLGARDTLRLEMGYALYGHELDADTTPIEAGYEFMLDLGDDRDFLGKRALLAKSPVKRLTPLLLEGRRAARAGSDVLSGGVKVGQVTSGVFSPSLKRAIALAYVDGANPLEEGAELSVLAGRSEVSAVVVSLPFYKDGTARKRKS